MYYYDVLTYAVIYVAMCASIEHYDIHRSQESIPQHDTSCLKRADSMTH